MKKLLTVFVIICCCHLSVAQNISGIINSYAQVLAIAGTTVTAGSTAGFAVGDKIIIIQMKGASITTTNTSAYGDITNLNNAGNWEFATISAINGNDITVAAPFVNAYTTTGKVQLVTVPAYCDVTITDTLTCAPWNGLMGGILAFMSGGTINMNADINVTGKGFRPGTACNTGFYACNNANWFINPTNCLGGWKGEGIAEYVNNAQSGGRAKLANGGGGSNPGNNGGGGGGNKGAGGLGGFEDNSCGITAVQGIGGLGLNYTLGKIFLGGAGGNGTGDDSQPIFPGTHGGGIVMISANTINPNGFAIRADGKDQTNITSDEGAGGGGAGGVVALDVITVLSPLTISADGGDGGSISNNVIPTGCQGPGGGGGGGVLWSTGAAVPINVSFTANGGSPGLMLQPASVCFNTPNGATAGAAGTTIFNFPSQTLPLSSTPVSLGSDFNICPLGTDTISTGAGYSSFLWQDGSTDSFFVVTDSGSYIIKAADMLGCFSADTVHVGFLPPSVYSMGNDTIVCAGQLVVIDAGAGFSSYLWQDLSTTQTYNATDPGVYFVTVVDTDGCIGLSSIKVNNFGIAPLEIGNDTSLCEGDKIIFNGGAFSDYIWQDGSKGPIFTATTPGIYYVTVTDFNGCVQTDTAEIFGFYQQPPDSFLNDTVLCTSQFILLEGPLGYASYLWTDSSTTSAITVLQPGIYGLTITSSDGCKSSDSTTVALKCPTSVFMPTAFSPNGDGVNDTYLPIGYNIKTYNIRIYNRWGQIVYLSSDYTVGWDGRAKEVKCEMGTYIYYVTWTGTLDGIESAGNLKGNLTLIR
ncbi:MAG: gliding motility-associated C-terminal domain-containing protein [Chitinophagaceae bacterium]|nr:gliding motility-associated C-terminal domain-containing protein [Chitinophagaceae bacterium]